MRNVTSKQVDKLFGVHMEALRAALQLFHSRWVLTTSNRLSASS
jgi:hypothetical protein